MVLLSSPRQGHRLVAAAPTDSALREVRVGGMIDQNNQQPLRERIRFGENCVDVTAENISRNS